MGTKERRERERASLRREILDAARELFIAEGYEKVSMRKIAEKIEYSPTTIYLYFKDKAELLFALTEETFSKLVKTLEAIPGKHRDPLTALKECGRAYIRFGLKYPNDYRVTFMMPVDLVMSAEHQFHGSMGERAFNQLREAVAECVRQKRFRRVDVETTSQAFWAAVHGITSLFITHHKFPLVDKEKLVDQMLDAMINGLKP